MPVDAVIVRALLTDESRAVVTQANRREVSEICFVVTEITH